MAYRGKKIDNPSAKMSIHFLQTKNDTGGKLLEMEATYQPHSTEPVAHYHPFQEEDFTVLAGELTVIIKGQRSILKAGDSLHVAQGVEHAMYNNSNNKTVVNWQVRPAMDTEHLLETTAGLASDGRVNKKGMPGILQVALMANKYSKVFRLSKPAFAIQKIVFVILTPLAYLAGLQASYSEYLD
jgi:quercetin dioxygenase-like cupin family protein